MLRKGTALREDSGAQAIKDRATSPGSMMGWRKMRWGCVVHRTGKCRLILSAPLLSTVKPRLTQHPENYWAEWLSLLSCLVKGRMEENWTSLLERPSPRTNRWSHVINTTRKLATWTEKQELLNTLDWILGQFPEVDKPDCTYVQ